VSQRRAQALRQELEDARDEKSLTLMNMKDADIPVPAVLSSKGCAAKPPAAKATPVPQPIVKKVVKKVKRQSKAPVAAPSAADVPQDLLDRAGGDARVARYLQKLSKEWEGVDARLNDMEASMTAAERTTVDLDRQLQEVASAPASGAASPASGSPSATKDLKKIQKKIAAAEAESQKLEDEKRTITDEVAKLQAQVESGATTFAALQETLESTTSSVAEARAKREALSLQADALRAGIEQTTKRAAEVAKELEEIKAKAQAKREEEVQAYRRLEKQRRVVYNQLQELRGNLRVYCRLRPRPAGEKAFVEPVDDITLKVTDPVMETSADYEFDLVMPEQTAQKDVFAEVQPLVTSVLDGYNVCVFAYGQTGSGKTHTMEGSANDRGVSFRTLTELFALAVARESEGYKTEFNLSVLEVYNDKIFDLLAGRKPAAARWGGKDVGVVVQPQQLEPVKSVEQVENLLQEAYKNRSVAGTDCNQHSSRSHCLLTIHVMAENASAKARFAAKLHLIDLAGSERVKSSGVEGDRLKEASHINMSLTHLKSVIQALAGKDDKHVPFRNSALTSLLQDSLGGNCKCLMFANVSTLGNNVPETICTLKYAAGARKVVVGKVTARVTKTAE
jgi:kinesin family protein C2/C3